MKVKFNKFERYAGAFVITAIFLSVFSMVVIGVENAWFAKRHTYYAEFEKAHGIFPGTQVEIAGLRAGTVDSVDLGSGEKIIVTLSIQAKFASRIREDSIVTTKRPFVIGEKMVEVTVGKNELPLRRPGTKIPAKVGFDLLELADPQKMQPYFETLGKLAESLRITAEAFTDPRRTHLLVEIFDKINPFLTKATIAAGSVTVMSDQMTRQKNLQIALENFAQVSIEMNKVLKENPNLSREAVSLLTQTHQVVTELNKVLPALAQTAPHIPVATMRTLEMLQESVIVLKAMQRSFLLRGSVKEVLVEEAKKEEQKRLPAEKKSK